MVTILLMPIVSYCSDIIYLNYIRYYKTQIHVLKIWMYLDDTFYLKNFVSTDNEFKNVLYTEFKNVLYTFGVFFETVSYI